MLFEHLIDPAFTPVYEAPAEDIVSAQIAALAFMDEDSVDTSPNANTGARDSALAQQAFTALTNPGFNPTAPATVLQMKSPQAVRHLVGMLSAYDWDFVNQAKELRGYVVAKLLEETKSADARIRLKSLELVGKLTEVAAFTERSEVTIKHEDTSIIEDRLRARLASMLPPQQAVQDIEVQEIAIVKHEIALPI